MGSALRQMALGYLRSNAYGMGRGRIYVNVQDPGAAVPAWCVLAYDESFMAPKVLDFALKKMMEHSLLESHWIPDGAGGHVRRAPLNPENVDRIAFIVTVRFTAHQTAHQSIFSACST